MSFTITAIFYGLMGLSISVAAWLNEAKDQQQSERWFRVLTACFFWPVYLPLLLQPKESQSTQTAATTLSVDEPDEFLLLIEQVETELDLVLSGLSGSSDRGAPAEQTRVAELRAAWRAKANRLRELETLIKRSSFVTDSLLNAATTDGKRSERSAQFEQSHQVNLAQLHAVRDRLAEDLVSILAAARERITLTHVARFSQQPMPDAMTLVAELITASEERRCNEN